MRVATLSNHLVSAKAFVDQIARNALVLLLACACQKQAATAAPYTVTSTRAGEGLRVEVRTSGEYHVNDEYPVTFQPVDGGRLQLKGVATKTPCPGDAKFHCAAAVPVPNVGGTLAFSVCSEEKCLIEKATLAVVP